jgi:AcrR family transcriptional regulator
MKTRDRILVTSLELFNEYGEPNVTTIHIADEMDISPGNLYYHFRNKNEIIYELYQQFEKRMNEILIPPPEEHEISMDDHWLFVHIVFEHIWEYRFVYRNLPDLLASVDKLATHFNRILDKKERVNKAICEGLIANGTMLATSEELSSLSQNITMTMTYWLNYENIRNKGKHSEDLGKGVYQVMSLMTPYLEPTHREFMRELSKKYL